MSDHSMVALIPARAGSKRVPGKNVRLLAGHPLLAYSIAAARQSGLFERTIVSTDDPVAARAAAAYGAEVIARAPELAGDGAADIGWVRDVIARLSPTPHLFAILRPTSPFRQAATIRRAWTLFAGSGARSDSLRAVEPVKQHPYKMWIAADAAAATGAVHIVPLHAGLHPDGTPWHSSPTQSLARVYVQNSSLEISRTTNVTVRGTISGSGILPFFTTGYEGMAIDDEDDWRLAERLVEDGLAQLPDLAPTAAAATR